MTDITPHTIYGTRIGPIFFREGFPEGVGTAVFWAFVLFVLRLIFGAHSFHQAAPEAAVACFAMFAAYTFGFCAPIFPRGRLIFLNLQRYTVKSTNFTLRVCAYVGAFMFVGVEVLHAVQPVLFTSIIWAVIYSAGVSIMVRQGVAHKQMQYYRDQGMTDDE
jgi:hypothetical protein